MPTLRLSAASGKPARSFARGAVVKPRTLPSQQPPDLSLFWIVWCRTELAPKKRHATLRSAAGEAHRLNTLFPEKTFSVYECREVLP